MRGRVLNSLLALACLSWLALGASLLPHPSGMGTHRQLGLPPCGWLASFGRPCPTCGMTTAFSHTSRGEVVSGFFVQPFATALAVGVSIGFWAFLHGALTGSVVPRVYAFLLSPKWVWVMVGFLALAWAYTLATWPGARE
jgi:Protein of unknown function (DUF2752)